MTLIIPSTSSTFADATSTEGEVLARKYVLAQFRSDASFEWVREIRAHLVRDELKYTDVSANRPRLKANPTLWSKLENGLGQASIIVIDPEPFRLDYLAKALDAGEPIQAVESDVNALVNACAVGMIGSTPIAYLPLNLARMDPWRAGHLVASLDEFTPAALFKSVGGRLRQATILAARAHAVFDLASNTKIERTGDVFDSSLNQVLLAEVLSTIRNFDRESPATVEVLNRVAREIADHVALTRPTAIDVGSFSLVRELDSRGVDELQAADIAAGWARELVDLGNLQALGARFERVWVNGRRVK